MNLKKNDFFFKNFKRYFFKREKCWKKRWIWGKNRSKSLCFAFVQPVHKYKFRKEPWIFKKNLMLACRHEAHKSWGIFVKFRIWSQGLYFTGVAPSSMKMRNFDGSFNYVKSSVTVFPSRVKIQLKIVELLHLKCGLRLMRNSQILQIDKNITGARSSIYLSVN